MSEIHRDRELEHLESMVTITGAEYVRLMALARAKAFTARLFADALDENRTLPPDETGSAINIARAALGDDT
jgi:hypothetical protein